MPKFAHVAAPLNKKLRNCQLQNFDGLANDEITGFETLTARLSEPSVLAPPRSKADYTVDTGASDKHIGCVLLQKHADGNKTSCEYWSRSLSDTEWA